MYSRLRAGAWYDPEHDIRYETGANEDRRVHFLEGEDELHFSAGIGARIGDRIELGIAADLSDRVDQISVFTIIRTGRSRFFCARRLPNGNAIGNRCDSD